MAKLRKISSIEHGLAEAIKDLKSKVIEEVTGKSDEGHKGKTISAVEKKEIFESFESLENKILKIKTTIENS